MTSIDLSTFASAAHIQHGGDKLQTSDNDVTSRESSKALGDKIVSWTKLHISGDTTKQLDQTRFEASLKQRFGENIGKEAYNAFAPATGQTHSLTKAQVLQSIDMAKDKLETEVGKALEKEFGEHIAKETLSNLKNDGVLDAAVKDTQVYKDAAQTTAKALKESIESHASALVADLTSKESLQEAAALTGIDIDWSSVTDADLEKLTSGLKLRLTNNSRQGTGASEQNLRKPLDESLAQKVTVEHLKLFSIAQSYAQGGENFTRLCNDLGLTPDQVPENVSASIKNDIASALYSTLGARGTEQLKTSAHEVVMQSVSDKITRDMIPEFLKGQEVSDFISEFNPAGDSDNEKTLKSILKDDINAMLRANRGELSTLTFKRAAETFLHQRIAHHRDAAQNIQQAASQLAQDNPSWDALQDNLIKYCTQESYCGPEPTKVLLSLQLEKAFRDNPELSEKLRDSAKSGTLEQNLKLVGNAINQIDSAVQEHYMSNGYDVSESGLEASQFTSSLRTSVASLTSPLLSKIGNSHPEDTSLTQNLEAVDIAILGGETQADPADVHHMAQALFSTKEYILTEKGVHIQI